MLQCVQCSTKYSLEDVQEGKFFPSTSTCLTCYKELRHTTCFGHKDKYDIQLLVCQECLDNRICRAFVKYRKEFLTKGE